MLQPVGFRVVAAAKTSYPCSLIWNKGRKEQAAGSLPSSRDARPGLVNGSARDPQLASDLRRRQAHGQPMPDGFHVDPGGAAAIGATLLRRGDPLGLALTAQGGLELGKDAEHAPLAREALVRQSPQLSPSGLGA